MCREIDRRSWYYLNLSQRQSPAFDLHNGSVERGIQSVQHGLNQHLSLAQTIAKINSSIDVDKLTNCQCFEIGKTSDTSVNLHDRYTVQVTALNSNGWYKVKYDDDDWKECKLVSKIDQSCEFKKQQLWNIHGDEVEKKPQDSHESSDSESTTTAAAPLNDDNDPTNYLPDRCVNQSEVDAITKDFVDDWIEALDCS
uniref:Tudor domain-containing protein n=1 Tax=Strongyloides venezuelensis TaxID=75913 RepID=A0A0K0FD14_STRVS